MNTSRYTKAQIFAILRQAGGCVPVAELCHKHGMSEVTSGIRRDDRPLIRCMTSESDSFGRIDNNLWT